MVHSGSEPGSPVSPLPPDPPGAIPPATGRPGLATERILLVDDEEVLRRLARSVLSRQGYEVVEASDPAEAIAIAARTPDSFDLILADVMMPGMRGYEMIGFIRPHQPRARVLYMSGYAGEIADAADRVKPLLPKPFRPRQLLDEIRRIIDTP